MKNPEVTSLYKYRSFSEKAISSLRDNTGWFAKPSSFNDPFDCAFSLDQNRFEETNNLLHEQFASKYGFRLLSTAGDQEFERAHYRRLVRQIRDLFQNGIGLYCLSEKPDDILMWSHYADSHRGFCIKYARLASSMLGEISRPVKYTDDYPSFSFEDLPKIVENEGELKTEDLYMTKGKKREYEREWRLIHHPGNVSVAFDFPITGIIFGARMSEGHRNRIRQVLAGSDDVRFYQSKTSETSFRLSIEDSAFAT